MKRAALKIVCAIALSLSSFALLACSKTVDDGLLSAEVIEIKDHGHLLLGVDGTDFEKAGLKLGDVVTVSFDDQELEMACFNGYYSNPGETMIRVKSLEDPISVCINYGNFAKEYGVELGDQITVTLKEAGAALDLQNLYNLTYSDSRVDYKSDEVFANFRSVVGGRLGEGKLYRSASPIDNDHNRAPYVNRFVEEAGVVTVLNLANANEDIEAFFEVEGFESDYYRDLYESGQVFALDLTANFFTEEFAQSLVPGFEYLADNEPPYLLHCKEGKDRAGFASMILASLMGASLDEIVADYMITYTNYYAITEFNEVTTYQALIENNLFTMIRYVAGLENDAPLEGVDLEQAATQYLLDAGMDAEKLEQLKEKLS